MEKLKRYTRLIMATITYNNNPIKVLPGGIPNPAAISSGGTSTGSSVTANGVLILTVVLVIIFVVLLIVLIVLLTRRPAETEEFGETSYY